MFSSTPPKDPIATFHAWLEDAAASEPRDPTAARTPYLGTPRMTAAAEIAIVVPMKPLRSAKSRLATALSGEERANLSLNMLARVLAAAVAHAHQVWVVGGDGRVRGAASDLGATWAADGDTGLNATLEEAFGRAARQGLSPMYLPADLPLLEADDVAGMIDASQAGQALTLSPASRDGGTNGIIVPVGSSFRPK